MMSSQSSPVVGQGSCEPRREALTLQVVQLHVHLSWGLTGADWFLFMGNNEQIPLHS